jgi:branched-chain amino acid transport system ATP-binding protein
VSEAPVLLEARDLAVVDDGAATVRAASLRLAEGTVLAVLGGPGAGKSALLGALAGTRRAAAGTIRLGGRDVTAQGPAARLRLGIAQARQRPDTFGGLTVAEHLELGRLSTRARAPIARARALRVLPELAGLARAKARGLGRGDRRLLDVARALISSPTALLLDEPSLELGAGRVARLVEALREEGIAVLLAERFPRPALEVADRACLLLGGRIVAEAAPEVLREDPRLAPACMGELMPD